MDLNWLPVQSLEEVVASASDDSEEKVNKYESRISRFRYLPHILLSECAIPLPGYTLDATPYSVRQMPNACNNALDFAIQALIGTEIDVQPYLDKFLRRSKIMQNIRQIELCRMLQFRLCMYNGDISGARRWTKSHIRYEVNGLQDVLNMSYWQRENYLQQVVLDLVCGNRRILNNNRNKRMLYYFDDRNVHILVKRVLSIWPVYQDYADWNIKFISTDKTVIKPIWMGQIKQTLDAIYWSGNDPNHRLIGVTGWFEASPFRRFLSNLALFKECSQCFCKRKQLKVCARCKCEFYCSRNCQKKHWVLHKHNCQKLASLSKKQRYKYRMRSNEIY